MAAACEVVVVAPGIFPRIFEMSTPVKAFTAGGTCPINLVNSAVVLSEPPIKTISSVFARGAATSAAICNIKKSLATNEASFDVTIPLVGLRAPKKQWQLLRTVCKRRPFVASVRLRLYLSRKWRPPPPHPEALFSRPRLRQLEQFGC